MARKFEVGGVYYAYAREYDPITVTRRTAKTIWVTNGQNSWRMRIRTTAYGDEIAIDSSVPVKWRDAFTYSADQGFDGVE